MSTQPDPTRRTDARTNREELETEAPLCPDLGSSGTDSTTRLRHEMRAMRDQLDRIERRLNEEADR